MSVVFMKSEWKDETTYSQGDKERVPSVWAIRAGGVRISIVSGHIHYPKQWVMHCPALGIDTYPLMATTEANLSVVKALAIDYAKERFSKLSSDFERLVAQA